MKNFLFASVLALSFAAGASAAPYEIDGRHAQVQFTYNHFGFSNITGRFDTITGSFDFDAAKPEKSSISIEIPIASVSTGVAKLDTHLQSADFFDAEKFPTATFKSRKVTAAGEGKLDVAGDLTIHGVTRPVLLAVTINKVGKRNDKDTAGFDASVTLKRSDFGMDNYVPAVSDEVRISITMESSAVVAAEAK